MKARFLYGNCCSAFYLQDGDWSSDYCTEILRSEEFFLFYYEAHNQIYCGLATINNFQELCDEHHFVFDNFKGWITLNYELEVTDLISWCTKYQIQLKRIDQKRIVILDGSAKYCCNSRSGNTSS